ncbi:MAG: hypothetical protein ABI960_09190 [Candidatus Eisenbacteria bacterium]
MRSSRGRRALAGLALGGALLLLAAPPARAAEAGTDAFTLEAPSGRWKRATAMDPVGRLTWTIDDPKSTTGQLRAEYVGVRATDPARAVAELLDAEKRQVRNGSDRVEGVDRGAFTTDSLTVGRLRWYGFRVEVKTGQRAGVISRWVALHPDFPRRRRAFTLALDEQTLPGGRLASREADARAVLRSLTPRGAGLGGGLATAYLDARAAAFAAHIDTNTVLCWISLGADAPPSRSRLGIGPGLALEGDFYQGTEIVPRDSVVDAGGADYGAAFDRNGDGRVDLLVMNRGITPARGSVVLPIAVVLADDDFDGRIDASVLENGDSDGDGRLDHRLLVTDADHDGRPDHAWSFLDAVADRSTRKVKVKDGLVSDRVAANPARLLDFSAPWREAEALMADIDRARAACRKAVSGSR